MGNVNRKNEVSTVATRVTGSIVVPSTSQDDFLSALRGMLSVSPICAIGEKFDTDALVSAESVIMRDVDIVDYIDANGKEVHYSVWAVEVDGVPGWHAGGCVLTDLADKIINSNLTEELREYGLAVNVTWDKTASGNPIARVTF